MHEEVKLPSSNAAKNDRGDNAGVSKDYLNKAALKIISKDSETKSTSSCVPQLKRGSSKEETSVAKSAKPTLAPVTRADSGKDNDSKSMPSTSKETKAKTIKYVDFSKLMDEVVFTLSGFVNPQRAELREKACEMGATFKSDWDKDCSHLICAFSNTPKYNQVKGKGKIVKADWIVDSHKNRKLMSWQKYFHSSKDSTYFSHTLWSLDIHSRKLCSTQMKKWS